MRSWRAFWQLIAVLVAAWVVDLALGGGRVHTVGWLAALVLIGGPAALVTRANQRREGPTARDRIRQLAAEQEAEPEPDRQVRPARPEDLALLPEVERRSDTVFDVLGIGPLPPVSQDYSDALAVLVVGDPPVGFARLDEVDGAAHLEQLSVVPRHMRRGHGTALVTAAADWATDHGYPALTLCTFRDVPFNAPFYVRLGFEPVADPSAGLAALRRHEAELGLDDLGARVVLRRRLG